MLTADDDGSWTEQSDDKKEVEDEIEVEGGVGGGEGECMRAKTSGILFSSCCSSSEGVSTTCEGELDEDKAMVRRDGGSFKICLENLVARFLISHSKKRPIISWCKCIDRTVDRCDIDREVIDSAGLRWLLTVQGMAEDV